MSFVWKDTVGRDKCTCIALEYFPNMNMLNYNRTRRYVVSTESKKMNRIVTRNPFRLPEEMIALHAPEALRVKGLKRRRIELVWNRDEITKSVWIGSCDAIPSKRVPPDLLS